MSGDDDSVTAVELVDPLVGTIFDKRFSVDERLAAGGFGAIYRATHVKSGHQIALKVLHPTLASDLGVLARFRREGTTLTSLRNPHTITAYEFGQVDKTLFIVLELLHGETLYDRYETGGPIEWKRVVHIAKQVCESLEEAHAQGIVHRDLKPTNIHLEPQGGDPDYVKVLDFGIAKILRGSEHDSSDITNVGQMIGTLDYMSPEQMVGGQVTGQTDIYTLGILMYEMIAGTRPFPESQTAGAALAAMLKTTPEPLYLRAPVPRELDAIVMRCLERETQKRFRSVGELRAALEHVVGDTISGATATVTLSKRFDDNDETTVTPPPEKVLDALRTPKPPTVAKPDAVRPARDKNVDPLAQTVDARVVRLGDAHTPSVELLKTPKLERRHIPEWDDEDEGAPTTTRRPDEYASLPSRPERRVDMPQSAFGPQPTPRPLASKHVPTPVPQIVVAPFSSTPKPPPAGSDPRATAQPPFGSSTTPGYVATTVGVPPAGAPGSRTPTPGVPYTHLLGPIPVTPPLPGPMGRTPTARFDMSKHAARDAAIRRLVWIIVLVVGAGVGFIIATQL